jgi:septum formation protein
MSPVPEPAALVCLASASPRRSALLRQIGVPHRIRSAEVDESVSAGEGAQAYVLRLARAKALAVRGAGEHLPVLGADTTVLLGDQICGKPAGEAEALAMLARLSGRTHRVLTAVALAHAAHVTVRLSVSEVRLRTLTEAEMRAYWASGEPQDKAGSYAVQGLGAVFVEHLSGSYSGVMGLPLCETAQLLERAGVAYWQPAGGR